MNRKWRKIHYHIFTSKRIQTLSPKGFTVYIAALVGADKFGRSFRHPEAFKASCLGTMRDVTVSDIRAGLQECVDCGLFAVYDVAGTEYIEMTKWFEHQGDETHKWGQTNIPNPDGSDANVAYVAINTVESVQKEEKTAEPKYKISNEQVENLIAEYRSFAPQRMNGVGKFREWAKVHIKSEQEYTDFVNAIKAYKHQTMTSNTEQRYVKHIGNFYKHWQDYLEMQTAFELKKPKGLTLQQKISLLEQDIDDKKRKVERGMQYDMQPLYEQLQELKSQLNKEM